MANIQLVVDSTAYLTMEMRQEWDVDVVPLSVLFEDRLEDEGVPGEFRAFYERLKVSRDFPKTSQPPLTRFTDVFERALEKGKEVLAITLSSGVSGTYQSACMAADMIDTDKISVVDSLFGAVAVRFMIQNTVERIRDGMERIDLVAAVKEDIKRIKFHVTAATLEYLQRGGRINAAAAAVGNILNIKPIIHVSDGVMTLVDKVRGFNKAIETIVAGIPETVRRIGIVHVVIPDVAENWRQKLTERFPKAEISVDEMGPVIGAHVGPGAMGICFEDGC